MEIYFIITIIVFCFMNIYKNKKGKIPFLLNTIIPVMILIIFAGIRYGIGTDYKQYQILYENTANSSEYIAEFSSNEYGYIFLMKFFNILHIDYNTFLIIIEAITLIIFTYSIKKMSIEFSISFLAFICLGLYGNTFNIIRQMLAAAIISIGIPYIQERKLKKFIIVIVIASLFHISSIIMIPLYYLFTREYKKVFLAIIPGIILVLNILGITSHIYSFIMKLNIIPSKYIVLYTNGKFTEMKFDTIYTVIITIIYYIYYFTYINRIDYTKINHKEKIFNNIFFIFVLNVLIANNIWILYRIFILYQIIIVFVIPKIIIQFKKNQKQIVKMFMIIVLLIIYGYVTNSQNGILPYESILTR